jgi:hypothetical protein
MTLFAFQVCTLAATGTRGEYQYAGKLFTEGQGRAPSAAEWSYYVGVISDGLTIAEARSLAISTYTIAEFTSKYNLDYEAMLKSLYLGALYREPDSSVMEGSSSYLYKLNHSTQTWSSVVASVLNSSEFTTVYNSYISPNAVFSFRTTSGPYTSKTEYSSSEINAMLSAASIGDTIALEQGCIVWVDEQITVPSGVKLCTLGSIDVNAYAKFARFVRYGFFNQVDYDGNDSDALNAMIYLEPGSVIQNLWIDGRCQVLGSKDGETNIIAIGNANTSSPTEILNCKICNTCGWTNLHVRNYNYTCGDDIGVYSRCNVKNNSICGYPARNCLTQWCDGVSFDCAAGTISGNKIVDTTDVGIVIFEEVGMLMDVDVVNNTIVSAGNNSWNAVNFDNSKGCLDLKKYPGSYVNMINSEISNNLILTGLRSHFNIAISAGLGARGPDGYGYGPTWNAIVTNNSIGASGAPANVGMGIIVSGMKHAYIAYNSMNLAFVDATKANAYVAYDNWYGIPWSNTGSNTDPAMTNPTCKIINNGTVTNFSSLWNYYWGNGYSPCDAD